MEGNFDFTTKPWAPSELKKLKIFKEICTDYRSYKKNPQVTPHTYTNPRYTLGLFWFEVRHKWDSLLLNLMNKTD